MTKKSEFFEGSGNVYADLGIENAEEMQAKAKLAAEIHRIMKDRGLTQQKTAKLLGTTQAKMSDVVRGQFHSFTIDRLLKMLLDLGQDVQITYRPKQKSHDHASLTVSPV